MQNKIMQYIKSCEKNNGGKYLTHLSTSDEKAKRLPEFPFSCFIVIKKVNSLLSFKILNDSFNIVSVTARYRLESEKNKIYYNEICKTCETYLSYLQSMNIFINKIN